MQVSIPNGLETHCRDAYHSISGITSSHRARAGKHLWTTTLLINGDVFQIGPSNCDEPPITAFTNSYDRIRDCRNGAVDLLVSLNDAVCMSDPGLSDDQHREQPTNPAEMCEAHERLLEEGEQRLERTRTHSG
jgi:hypothetical protein